MRRSPADGQCQIKSLRFPEGGRVPAKSGKRLENLAFWAGPVTVVAAGTARASSSGSGVLRLGHAADWTTESQGTHDPFLAFPQSGIAPTADLTAGTLRQNYQHAGLAPACEYRDKLPLLCATCA